MVKDKEDWKKSFNKAMCAVKMPHIESQSGEAKEIDKSTVEKWLNRHMKNFNRSLRNAQKK